MEMQTFDGSAGPAFCGKVFRIIGELHVYAAKQTKITAEQVGFEVNPMQKFPSKRDSPKLIQI